MSYRKWKADGLFDGDQMYPDAVLICRENGIVEELVSESEAGGDIEILSGILCPGFINAHCHLELSHLKGEIPEHHGLVNFVFSVVNNRNHPTEYKQEAIRQAETDMRSSGIVAVGDICNTTDTLQQKTARNLDYYNLIEVLGWLPEQAESRFKAGLDLAQRFQVAGLNPKHISLNPHAPYSVSEELWKKIMPGFAGKTITIHNQETQAENEFFHSASGDLTRMYEMMKIPSGHFNPPGTNSLPYYLPRLVNASRILLVHNTFLGDADLQTAIQFGIAAAITPGAAMPFSRELFLCLCPNANLYIENRLPDIPLFIRKGAKMVLGTDSLASNHQLSILEEMKTIKKAFPEIPTTEMLRWATSNGARALGFDEQLGSFTEGKKSGVTLISQVEKGEITTDSTSARLF